MLVIPVILWTIIRGLKSVAINIELVQSIDHPPARVFAALADIRRHPEWIEEMETLTQPPQLPVRVGTTYQHASRYYGRSVTIDVEVTALEPDRLLQLRSEGSMPTLTTWRLEPDSGGTRLHFVFEGQPGELYDMISAGLEGSIKRSFQAQIEKLKAILDSEA